MDWSKLDDAVMNHKNIHDDWRIVYIECDDEDDEDGTPRPSRMYNDERSPGGDPDGFFVLYREDTKEYGIINPGVIGSFFEFISKDEKEVADYIMKEKYAAPMTPEDREYYTED